MINTFQIDDHNITFVNESKNTRSGFKHVSRLYINGMPISEGTRYYYNRTWERYRFQSSMIECVEKAIKWCADDLKENIMQKNNWKRLSPARSEAIRKAINEEQNIQFYNSILKYLKDNCLN